MSDSQIGTVVIVVNSKRQILLGKRKNAVKSGYYGLPGGRLEEKEKLHMCVHRELKEETSLEANSLRYLCVVKEWQEDEQHDFVHFIFVCDQWSSEPKLAEPDKCEGWHWFGLDELPAKIMPGHLEGIQQFRRNRQGSLIDN